ncbi:MAG TPA: hypothetical protein DDZ53_11320 [Firmicutes bacterium]|nr:hypothetical protein [Bacillota bacterium]
MDMWFCPNCNSRAVGKVGQEHYYCSDCCVEFARRKDGVVLFEVADDGTLVAFATCQPTI